MRYHRDIHFIQNFWNFNRNQWYSDESLRDFYQHLPDFYQNFRDFDQIYLPYKRFKIFTKMSEICIKILLSSKYRIFLSNFTWIFVKISIFWLKFSSLWWNVTKISQRFWTNFSNMIVIFLKYLGHNLEDLDQNLVKLLKMRVKIEKLEDLVQNKYKILKI